MALDRIKRNSKKIAGKLVPASIWQAQLHRHAIMRFADRIGLVYFGYVDQHRDEHTLVRGLTISPRHHDSNYCVGSFDNYDITLVERTDTLQVPNKPARPYRWLIMTFDLHARVDLPHVFVGLHSDDETFYEYLFTKFSRLAMVPLGILGLHDNEFVRRYSLYTPPEQALSAERLFRPSITKVIAHEFAGLTVEISEGTLYLYGENYRPTPAVLERMLRQGLWLARTLDTEVEADTN